MNDATAPPADEADAPARPPVPRTVNLVIAAVSAQVFFQFVRVGAMFGFSDDLKRLLIKSNNDLKVTNKNRKNPYTPDQVAHDLHQLRTNGLYQGLVIGLVLLLLAFSLRRISTASVTRWALLVVMVLAGGPLQVIPSSGWPPFIQITLVLAGVAAIAAIVLLFLPDSRAYFRAVAALRRGQYVAKQGGAATAPRPTLRSMFAPKPAPVSLDKPRARADASAAARGAKSKSRTEAEAVARGAQLARERAKASKSRRTDSS